MNITDSALLVVDDNGDNRYTLVRRLNRQGYTNVTTADDGHQALELLREKPFDLVLLDIMMPGMNGYEVLEHLKADGKLRELPVIMISALDEQESVIRCIELGAEDYLPKPFNPTLLKARIGASLEKKRLRDSLRSSLDRLEREIHAARRMQAGMLPREFPACTEAFPVAVHALMEPAREVGGDLYDFFEASPGVLTFLVADVSGKGADAAMFMARTRSAVRLANELLHRAGTPSVSPAAVLQAANGELCQNNRERMFVTVFVCFLDVASGLLEYANAGHPLPYRISADGLMSRIDTKPQRPLGVHPSSSYTTHRVALAPGDAVFICSDGIADAMNPTGEMYGESRLEAALAQYGGGTPQHVVETVKQTVDGFVAGAQPTDDITLLMCRWKPEAVA